MQLRREKGDESARVDSIESSLWRDREGWRAVKLARKRPIKEGFIMGLSQNLVINRVVNSVVNMVGSMAIDQVAKETGQVATVTGRPEKAKDPARIRDPWEKEGEVGADELY